MPVNLFKAPATPPTRPESNLPAAEPRPLVLHMLTPTLPSPVQGCDAVICMPTTTPDIKVRAVRRLGGTVELVGDSYTETQTHAQVRTHLVDGIGGWAVPDAVAGLSRTLTAVKRSAYLDVHLL